ncbi:hypothetical protein [Streptomonospora litoralis]|uniref:Uncharacterized protein n=1 Tax=Streptomonospora litoralis TaxID=2498135 RepID=A0A4P6Q121_9ACTN|nr:hypothetical protein [Streptomonospora litoralis]QBI52394.1 hypothetical protein EKD16_02895 [Streptomonospora litoralis]
MELVQLILWNGPFVVLPLLGFMALVPAPAGRRMLPAFGLVLILVYGVGYVSTVLLSYFEVFWRIPPLPVVLGQRVLDLALAAGFLLLLLGLIRGVRTGPAPKPDPAWSAPPPAAGGGVPSGHGGPVHPGNPGAYPQRPAPQPHAGPGARPQGPGAHPSGPNSGAAPPPAPAPPPGGAGDGQEWQGPPPWQYGPSGPRQRPGGAPQADG